MKKLNENLTKSTLKQFKAFKSALLAFLQTDLELEGYVNEEQRLKRLKIYTEYINLINRIEKNPENYQDQAFILAKSSYESEIKAIYV
jgi:hypothetical protein